ncbi:MAG: hypothetical protein WBG37_02355 [Desulfobacterales bacterium]
MKRIGRVLIAVSSGILFLSSSAACGRPHSVTQKMSTDQIGPGSHLNTDGASECRPEIATANRPARVFVDFQNTARSHGTARIALTLRPEPIGTSQRYVIQVFAVGLTGDAGLESAEEYLGSYTAFAPQVTEQPITLMVRAPKRVKAGGWAGKQTIEIEVRLEPVSPETPLKEAVVSVIDARVVP